MRTPADFTMPNAFVPGSVSLPAEEEALIVRREQLLGPAYRLMYQKPLHIVRGEGVWLFDEAGRRYLDAYNNVASMGHCHPRIVEAIQKQVAILATNTRYLHTSILDYTERLLNTFPKELKHVMFACSGSEANDVAYRIAKQHTGGVGVIVTDYAFHGMTDAVSQFSPTLGSAVNLGAHVRTVPAPARYRMPGQDIAETFERNVETAIEDLRRHGIKPAMLIVDSVFTSDGGLTEPSSLLEGAVAAIRKAGGLFVADEVQSGFGRTGDHMWGFQRHGVIPDIVTLGKPMGNGQPISGVVVKADVVESFGRSARYFNTLAGNAVSCAAALAVLDTIEEESLLQNSKEVGAYFLERLCDAGQKYGVVGDVRGAGLLLSVELVKDRGSRQYHREAATKVVNELRENGILISVSGPGYNVVKIRPPLVFTRENVDQFVSVFDSALAGV